MVLPGNRLTLARSQSPTRFAGAPFAQGGLYFVGSQHRNSYCFFIYSYLTCRLIGLYRIISYLSIGFRGIFAEIFCPGLLHSHLPTCIIGIQSKGAYQVRRLPADPRARGLHRRRNFAHYRGQSGPRGLPGARARGLSPHGCLPYPAHVAQAEHDDPGFF